MILLMSTFFNNVRDQEFDSNSDQCYQKQVLKTTITKVRIM